MVLLGNMQNLPICRDDWKGAEQKGFDLAFVRSSRPAFSDAFVWNDLEAGTKDLGERFRRLKAMGELEYPTIIMAGFSAGERMALHTVMTGLVKTDDMVLMGPWLPEMDKWSDGMIEWKERMPGAHTSCGDGG
jgi:predicted esterase